MTYLSGGKQQSAFSHWLRTGRLPSVETSDGVELKFNPWHDPDDGRFTFAGSGHYYGRGEAKPKDRRSEGPSRANPPQPRTATRPKQDTLSTDQTRPSGRGATGARPKPPASRREGQPNPAIEFIGGVGEGLYGVAEGTVEAAYATLTNPIATARNVGRGIAGRIDAAIAADDTPAHIQLSRAADAIANASPREIGRVTGSVVGSTALVTVPGVAVGKVAGLRRLRQAAPQINYDPPQIGWVKENLGRDTPAKQYNDAATGARPGQAPILMRTMPDGSKRPVKFDGVEREYLIDRKSKVVDAPRARDQLLRQSKVLEEHGLIATWEVPTPRQRAKALKLLKKMNVTNIKVRVVKP